MTRGWNGKLEKEMGEPYKGRTIEKEEERTVVEKRIRKGGRSVYIRYETRERERGQVDGWVGYLLGYLYGLPIYGKANPNQVMLLSSPRAYPTPSTK